MSGSPVLRWIDLLFGGGLLVIAAYALFALDDGDTTRTLLALAVGVVGAQALLAAMRGRRSWLSRLGPLP